MLKQSISSFYFMLIPIFIIGLSLGYSSFLLSLLALIPLFFLTTRHTVGFFLIMYGGVFGGVIRAVYPWAPVYGILLIMIGGLLLWDIVLDLVNNHNRAILMMCLILVLFGFFYLIGPLDEFSRRKYFTMWLHGLLALVGYYTLLKSSRIDAEGLTIILITGSICLISFSISYYNFTQGVGLFDFNWFREQCIRYDSYSNAFSESPMIITYQDIGMMSLYGAAIMLSMIRVKSFRHYSFLLFAFLIILISGCRQAILGFVVIAIMRFSIFRVESLYRHNTNRRFLLLAVGLLVALIAFELISSQVDIVRSTVSEGDERRLVRFKYALQIFKDNPIFGVGLGGYHYIVKFTPWPHNFFLELLSECGIIGTVLFLTLLFYNFVNHKINFLIINSSNLFYFILFIAPFVRYMVSADFRDSIELFAAVYAIAFTVSRSNRYSRKTIGD